MNDHISPHPDKAALMTVDVQRDFVLSGAAAEIPGTAQIIPAIQQVVSAFRTQGLPIIHVVRLYLPDGSNADLYRRDLISRGKQIVTPGSMGAELVDELKPNLETRLDATTLLSGAMQSIGSREWVIYKSRWGAFYSTILEKHLRGIGVDTLIVTGCNFPNCPRSTIYEASERDFRLVLVTDAVSGFYEQGAKELANIGVSLLTSSQLIKWCSINAA